MKFIVEPATKNTYGYCYGCKEQCNNDCTTQCASKRK